MPSDSADHHRTTTGKHHHLAVGAPPPEPEHLPCPRCDSTNTKFYYYNNYNFSQPRHFCKACRRCYWTHGGTLRDIPVGGGIRKNAKRSRPSTAVSSSSSDNNYNNSGVSSGRLDYHRHTVPVFPFAGDHGGGSFTSLLSNSQSRRRGCRTGTGEAVGSENSDAAGDGGFRAEEVFRESLASCEIREIKRFSDLI